MRRFVNPFVQRAQVQELEDAESGDHRPRREGNDLFPEPGVVEHGLVVLFHRGELFRAYIKRIVYFLLVERHAEVD